MQNTGESHQKKLHDIKFAVNGFTIIEILISIAVTLIIMQASMVMYRQYQQTQLYCDALVELQQNASLAVAILQRDIHQAGYLGCVKLGDTPFKHINQLHPNNKISGNNKEITIGKLSSSHAILMNHANAFENKIFVDNSKYLHTSKLVISDCMHAEDILVRQISRNKKGQILFLDNPLKNFYPSGAEISKFEKHRFYVGKTSRKNRLDEPIYALYVQINEGAHYELVPGIHKIQISYLLTNGQWKNYVNNGELVRGLMIKLEIVVPPLRKHWQFYTSVRSNQRAA